MRPKHLLLVALVVVVVGVVLGRLRLAPDAPTATASASNVLGSPSAPVEVEEWGDFG